MTDDNPRNLERRRMYAFKRDLEGIIKSHGIDKLTKIPVPILASFLVGQLTVIDRFLDNLENKNGGSL